MTDNKNHVIPIIEEAAAVEPTSGGLEILSYYFPDDADYFLMLARSGAHMQNPYHNLHHELSCVHWAHACAMNSREVVSATNLSTLIFAALFHDHNHSGGRASDLENIRRATEFISSRLVDSVSTSMLNTALSIIRCTEFTDGKFPHEPSSFMHQCMRDADLMMIYSPEGRNLLIGLGAEMGFNFEDDHEKFMEQTRAFLTNARMYTEYGQYMQSTFLADSLDCLELDVAELRDELLCAQ